MISEGSCDTEVMAAENSAIIEINYILKYIKTENSNSKLYYLNFLIFLLIFWSNNCLGEHKAFFKNIFKNLTDLKLLHSSV